jgi:hypothetical protein
MWGGIDSMVLSAADQRLTNTVEKGLANAALILALDIAGGRRSMPIMR